VGNFVSVTSTIPEDYNNDYAEERFTDEYYRFVNEISEILKKFDSVNQLTEDYKWTKFEWMIGYYIMSKEEDEYNILNTNVKSLSKYVKFTKIGEDDMSLNLKQAFDISCRWNLNAKSVWESHKTLMSSLQHFYNKIVFDHAYLIMKYLDYIIDVTDKILGRILDTFKLYKMWI